MRLYIGVALIEMLPFLCAEPLTNTFQCWGGLKLIYNCFMYIQNTVQ